jgi:5-methylcytosine-specific restriction endonuclease McrA
VHHIRPLRVFKEEYDEPEWYELANDLDNLVSLCASCHHKWEGIPLRPDKR